MSALTRFEPIDQMFPKSYARFCVLTLTLPKREGGNGKTIQIR